MWGMIERINIKDKYRLMRLHGNEFEAYIQGVKQSYPDDPVISIPAFIDADEINNADFEVMRNYMYDIGELYDDFCLWLARKCKAKGSSSLRGTALDVFVAARERYKKIEGIYYEIYMENEFRSIDKEVEKLDNVLKTIPPEELKRLWI
jgi:hypothetical protein